MQEIAPLKLSQLTASLEAFFKKRFEGRRFRVIGEVSNHKAYPNRGWHFFDLIEKDDSADRLVAKMNAVAWRPAFESIERFEKECGQRFTDGIEVLVTAELSYTSLYGMKMTVIDIDPSYTMGRMERLRRETLRKLVERYPQYIRKVGERFVTSNQGILVAQVIQTVAVISSPGAAGYEDFIHTLTNNSYKYTFQIDRYYARVQGQDAAPILCRRLAEIAKSDENYDLVVIIRGGGAQTDLFVFDDFALNREIARLNVPLWTGIGHQRDITIADLFCHTSHKTPTRVAEAIVYHNRSAEEQVAGMRERLLNASQVMTNTCRSKLAYASLTITAKAPALIRVRRDGLRDLNGRMQVSAKSSLLFYKAEINALKVSALRASARMVQRKSESLLMRQTMLASHGRYALRQSVKELDDLKLRLKTAAANRLNRYKVKLEHSQSMLRMLDPENLLKRGYALLEHEGKIVSNSDELNVGVSFSVLTYRERLNVNLVDKSKRHPAVQAEKKP